MPTARRVALVYWLLDCSGSMSGEKIATLNMAMGESLLSLRSLARRHPDMSLQVRVMAFAKTVKWMMPSPASVDDVSWHGLTAHGVTNTGAALKALSEDPALGSALDVPTAVALLLVSDGMPTKPSEYREGLEILRTLTWWRDATRVAIAIGPDADGRSLAEFASEAERGILNATKPEELAASLSSAVEIMAAGIARTSEQPIAHVAGGADSPEMAEIGILPLSVFD